MSDATAAPPPAAPYDLRHGLACAGASLVLGLTQGFGLYLVGSNLPAIQGSLGATAAEASWLTTAYFASTLSGALLMVKVRLHFGLRRFARFGLLLFFAVAALHLCSHSLATAIAARAALGLAAASVSSLAVLYMVEAFPPRAAVVGLVLGFLTFQLPLPLSRVVATELLDAGQWHGLFRLDVALAALSFVVIQAVRLATPPLKPSFNAGDAVAFPLYATAMALLAVVVSQGRTAWWTDAPWIGVCLAASIACFALYVLVDLPRESPLINLRWLASPYMVTFVLAVILFRVVLSEQTVGVVGLMGVLGQNNEQMRPMFALAALALVCGFALAIVLASRQRIHLLAPLAALIVMGVGWMDSDATSLTRPQQLYTSQFLLAFALAVFFAAAVLRGFIPVFIDGGRNLVSLLAAFNGAQYLGTLLGTAWVQTLVAHRQTWHYAALAQHLSLADPQVATRVAQLSGSVARFVNDPGARSLQGLTTLSQQITRESFVLAYNDVFQSIAAICLAMFFWLAWLGWRRRRGAAQPAVHPASPT